MIGEDLSSRTPFEGRQPSTEDKVLKSALKCFTIAVIFVARPDCSRVIIAALLRLALAQLSPSLLTYIFRHSDRDLI